MNKIYQVIWSKTKHMYIVVSELAHHDGKAKTTVHKGGTAFAKATAALVLAALLNAAPVYAEDKTVDIGNGGTATYTEKGDVVIGKDNTVPNDGAGKNVVTGTGNSAQHVDGTGNAQKFLPDDPKLVDNNNGNPSPVETPGNTKGLDSAVISGNGASAEADGDTSIGKGANITNPLVPYYADENGNATSDPNAAAYFYQNGKLVKGTDGLKYATGATDADGNPVVTDDPYYKHTYETTVTILHPDGTIERKKLDPMTVINQDPSASPTSYNTTKDDEGNIITTKVKETETPTRNLADGYSYYSQNFYDPSTDSIAAGTDATVTGKDAVAAGHDSQAAGNSVAVGNKASSEEGGTAVGPAAAAGTGAVATGIGANADNFGVASGASSNAGENAVAVGDGSYAGDSSQAIGSGSQATVVSTAVGTGSQATLNSTAVGNGSKATGAGSAALGNNSSATADGGVALGNDSVADRGAENYGWDPVTKSQATAEDKGTDPVWYSNRGAVSVGISNPDGTPKETRQITNVAAGTNDGDAVNVAQLKSAVKATQTHYYSWNDRDDHQYNYDNEGATGNRALAAGIGASAAGDGATSVGNYTNASGKTSIAIGGTALDADGNKKYEQVPKMVQKVDDNGQPVTDDEGNPVMVQATDDEGNLLTENKLDSNGNPIPLNTEATGENAIAVGTHAKGWGQDSIAVGTDSKASATDATAVGRKSNAWAPSASAFGAEAEAGQNATAVGKTSHAYNESATSVGANSNANYYATAVGQHANATSGYDTAVGQNSTASGSYSVAVGNSAMSSSNQATAVGDNAHAENNQATALGYSSMASGSYSTAVGQSANATPMIRQ